MTRDLLAETYEHVATRATCSKHTIVTLMGIDPHVEEQVVVRCGELTLTCFASSCPYALEVGNEYPVTFHPWAIEGIEPRLTQETVPRITPLDQRGRYEIVGRLEGEHLDAGIRFEDAVFPSDYAYLSGQVVYLTVDRIHVWFE